MARKQLIKGANAVRVEERIARVPEDVGSQASIFRALKNLEESSIRVPAAPEPKAATVRKTAKPSGGKAEKKKAPPVVKREEPRSRSIHQATPKPRHIGPADFNAAEREAIVRCCADYRNRLPIYLLAVQREVEVLDSVIEKCRAVEKKGAV